MHQGGDEQHGSGNHSNRRRCEWHLKNSGLDICMGGGGKEEGTDDGSTPCFAVLFEELEKVMTNEDIKIDGDFVKKKNVPR